MRAFVAVLGLSACTQGPAAAWESGTLDPLAASPSTDRGVLRGRVVTDGHALTHFGVVLSPNWMSFVQSAPFAVRTSDGRFEIHGVPPYVWDIVVLAPGVGTLVVPQREVTAGAELDLGELVVPRGATFAGRVRDASGRPITDARVRIVSSSFDNNTSGLTGMAVGNYETRTDAHGAYRFDGVTIAPLRHYAPWLLATYGTLHATARVRLTVRGAATDLVMREAGAIDGVVATRPRSSSSVSASTIDGEFTRYATLLADGSFRFDNLPPDVYEIRIGEPLEAPPAARVRVVGGERRIVRIEP